MGSEQLFIYIDILIYMEIYIRTIKVAKSTTIFKDIIFCTSVYVHKIA